MAALTFTLTEPQRKTIGEEETNTDGKKVPVWKVILQPRIIVLCLAASIRHCGKRQYLDAKDWKMHSKGILASTSLVYSSKISNAQRFIYLFTFAFSIDGSCIVNLFVFYMTCVQIYLINYLFERLYF